jgi:hypothetical protein
MQGPCGCEPACRATRRGAKEADEQGGGRLVSPSNVETTELHLLHYAFVDFVCVFTRDEVNTVSGLVTVGALRRG